MVREMMNILRKSSRPVSWTGHNEHMRTKWGLLLFIMVAGALTLFLWIVRPPREPVYQGRPLSSWLAELEDWDGDTNNAAFVTFREMSTNAIPALLKDIQSDYSPIQRLENEINKKQSLVQLPSGTPWRQSIAATWGLYAMGTNAKPALPALTNLLFHTNEIITSAIVLAGIGSEGVPPLLAALTNQDWRIRHATASGLAWERSDIEMVVPALIASLRDNQRLVRTAAVISLGNLHVKPELVVPALANAFSNNDASIRGSILISLGEFGVRAKDCVPLVVTALKDNDGSVRECAGFAIKQIDPEAARKAGGE